MKTLFQLSEATKSDQHHVTAFTRMNPPTTGHMQLIDKVHSVAKDHGADHSVVVSHSQDPKKNPLSSDQKKKHLKRFSPETNVVASSKEHPTILHHLSSLHKAGVTHAHIVAGSDRHAEMHKLTNAYNGKKAGHGYYKFKKITIHSAGERDPDAEGTSGVSATKQREHAASGNFKEFRKGVPSHVSDEHTKDLMNDVKNGQKTKKNEELEMESLDNLFEEFMIEDSESFSDAELWNVVDQTSFSDLDPNENDSDFIETLVGESIEEDLDESRVLSILQRQRAKMKFKQRQPRMKRMRELKRKRMATPQRLTYRARTSALMMLRKRIAGQKGLAYHKLPPSQRYAIDKAVQARYGKNLDKLVGTLSKRTLPMIRKKEMTRLAKARGQNVTMPAQSKSLYQSYDVKEDPDYISTNNDHLLTPKVNMLLRLGLVDQDEIEKYRRALKIGEKALSSPELRSKILSMLDKILKMATDDPQTFARIRAMVVLKKKSQNEEKNISKDPLENDPLEVDPLKINKMDLTPEEGHLTLRKKMIRQHESKTFTSLREKMKDQYDPLAEDKIAESLYNKSVKYNVSIDAVVEVYEAALKDSGNENVAFDAVNSFLANHELDEVQRAADMKRIKVRLPDGRTVYRNERRADSVQDEEVEQMDESHFKTGDKVKCKTSGMRGEVVKLDKEEGADDEKYYTIKGEDGKMRKMAPKDMIKEEVDTDSIFEIEMYVPEIHEARGDHLLTIQGGRGKGRKFMHKDTSTDDHLSAMEFHLKAYHVAKKSKLDATKNHHAKMYHKHKDQIEALGGVGNHLKESNAHKILAQKIQQMAIRKKMTDDALARHNAEQEKKGVSKDAETKFHTKLDSLVHDTFGKRKSEESVAEMYNRTASDDRREIRANSPKAKAKREKEQQERLKQVSSEMRKKLGLPEPKEGVAEASNRMQKYGQLIIKRARQAKREAEAAEKAKRDAEQEKTEKEKKQGVAEGFFSPAEILKIRSANYNRLAARSRERSRWADDIGYKEKALDQIKIARDRRIKAEKLKKQGDKLDKLAKKGQGVAEEGGAGEFGTPELTKNYARETPGQCQEILNMNTADMGDVIKDFKKSDAPQFKGKSVEKRRQMAIAAKLSSQDKE